MCGICGYSSFSRVFSETDLKMMASSMAHRGPDADGFYLEEHIGLGHRRLSIIDLSTAANLPMTSQNSRYVMVYNGEVYNYKEIAEEFKILNFEFKMRTSSDSEVILEAYSLWGVDFIQKLNGMFAIAIYDKQEKSLFLCRDRVGVKPIYYYWDGQNLAFASELKSLIKIPFIKKNISVSSVALNEYLHLGYVPDTHSVYKNIYKFPSGSFAKIDKNGLKLSKYWALEDKINDSCLNNEQEAYIQLKELLISSVKYRMIADVPFGTFLSGGIDSSLVTAIAQSLSKDPIKTFNIRFAESKFDESMYARTIAEYLKTTHHEFTVTEKEAIATIPNLLNIYDEPFADPSAIPTLMVSKIAKQKVTMILSGDGGDELFLGYGAYKWAQRLNHPLIKTLNKPLHILSGNLNNRYRRASELFNHTNKSTIKSHIFSQEQYYFSRNEIRLLLNNDVYREFELNENYNNLSRKLSPKEQQSLFDFNYYLKDDLLVKVDRASMKHSLEVRVPLLDYRIVEFAYNLSPDLRYKNGISKYLLKKVLYDYIPESYFNRPKWGFSIPLCKWLKNDLAYLIDEHLSSESIKNTGLLNEGYVAQLVKQFRHENRDYLFQRIWQLIIFQKFFS